MSAYQIIKNGWIIIFHPLFLHQLEQLVTDVENLSLKDPVHYKSKSSTKRLAAIAKLIFEKIPLEPTAAEYRQGTALGNNYKHWFRAKFFQQYRLFFRYHQESKIIIYAWVNDEGTKRAYESKTDAYQVFKKMLANGNPPDTWEQLRKECASAAQSSTFSDSLLVLINQL